MDPELVLFTDSVWLEYSKRWNNRVIGWLCEGASGSYGLCVFDRGDKRREVMVCEGEVVTDVGEPLNEESYLNWEDAWEDDVILVVKQLGVDYDFPINREYVVFRLDESRMEI